jgi:hypothetical protein
MPARYADGLAGDAYPHLMGVLGGLCSFGSNAFLDDPRLPPVAVMDVEKAWHPISLVLCPADDPLPYVNPPHPLDPMRGGTPFDADPDGETRYFDPEQVRAIAERLRSLTDDDLRSRFEPDRFAAAGIYWGEVWARGDPDDTWASTIQPGIAKVRAFYDAAAGDGLYVVTWIA